jgi:hypothetical protein
MSNATMLSIPYDDTMADDDPRRARILAKTIYRELRSGGLDERGVLGITTELLGLLADDLRGDAPET